MNVDVNVDVNVDGVLQIVVIKPTFNLIDTIVSTDENIRMLREEL